MERKLRDNIPFIEPEKQNITRDLLKERKEQKKDFDQKVHLKETVDQQDNSGLIKGLRFRIPRIEHGH